MGPSRDKTWVKVLILPLGDLEQPLWASMFSTVKWEDNNKRVLMG